MSQRRASPLWARFSLEPALPAWLSAKNVAFRSRCLDWGLWTGGCVPPRPRVSCDQFNPFITSIQSNARNQKNEALLAKFQHAPSWKHYSDPIRMDHVTFLKNSQFLPYSNVPENISFLPLFPPFPSLQPNQ
jgi:hypothetical protein